MSRRPAIALRSVDFPQPEGPRRTRNSPSWAVTLRRFRTFRWPKVTSRSRTDTSAIASALHRARRDAAYEPAARDEIDDQRNCRGQDRGGHVDVVLPDTR